MKTKDNEVRATGATPNLQVLIDFLRKVFSKKTKKPEEIDIMSDEYFHNQYY